MEDYKKLKLGMAYHGNRMPHHAEADLEDMVRNGMDIVVHMLSHTDWRRHLNVMKDIVAISEEKGLESWIDNWGLAGSPGDTSFFLAMYPDSHAIFSDGTMDPVHPCLYSEDFRRFTKEWIDAAEFIGGKTIFWDEPAVPAKMKNEKKIYCCACPSCRKRFAEKYGRQMPEYDDEDTARFANDSVVDYMNCVTEYSHSKGMKNVTCVMLGTYGMSLEKSDKVAALPYMDNIGSDPYWISKKAKNPELDVYEFVYNGAKETIGLADRFGKDHNVWIQTYSNPRGSEEDIVLAAEAAYDAGARTILGWGYYGSESNDYRAKNPIATWSRTCEAFARIREMERDRILAEKRKLFLK